MEISDFTHPPNVADKRRLTTIVATDICGYSSLSEKSDSTAIHIVDTIYALFVDVVDFYNGRIFKRMADGFLAEFQSAESGVLAALEFTRKVKALASEQPLPLETVAIRTGIHVGDVTKRRDGDLLGHGVNVAVRLQENANKNGILASKNIIDLLGENLPYSIARYGTLQLKNITTPVVGFYILDVPPTPLNTLIQKVKVPSKKFVQLVTLPILVFGLTIIGNMTLKTNVLPSRIEKIQTALFSDPSLSSYEHELNSSYLYRILQDLGESKQPSDRSVFALIETGDIDKAVTLLNESLDELEPGSTESLSTLHQIGALTYQRDPKAAIKVYEQIVSMYAKDVAAITRLGRSYDVIGNVCKARHHYDTAINLVSKETDQYTKLELDRAFNFIMGGDAQKALTILNPYVDDFRNRNPDSLWSLFQTEYGIALERAGETKLSNAVLSAAIHQQEKLSDYSNVSRSYNILGFLAVRKAQENSDFSELYFKEAIGHFSNQLEIDTRIGRTHTLPGAHYFLGDVYQKLRNIPESKKHYKQGLALSKEYKIMNFEFLNLIGLATLEDEKANRDQACELMELAQKIYDENIDSGIGPKTTAKINSLGCGFNYKPQPSQTNCEN